MERLQKYRRFLALGSIFAIGWSLMQIYSAAAGFFPLMLFRPLHVAFALALTFTIYPMFGKPNPEEEERTGAKDAPGWSIGVDYLLIAMSVAIGIYYVINSARMNERVVFIDPVYPLDIFFGTAIVLLSLEACRRVVGPSLTILASLFLAYQLWGSKLPGLLRHGGLNFNRFIDLQAMTPQGLFGVPTGVSADYVFYFILFAAFLELSGGGKLFIDLAFALTGRARGGPAKAAIVGSSLMGTISGSAVANVVGTGIFTIPLMKRTGLPAHFAGAVEALASSGGQIMPPIMGAGAFIMAQMLGWPYPQVAIAAIIPAVLYYVAAFFMVDLKARKDRLQGISKEELPDMSKTVSKLHLLLPLIFLVWMILSGYSLMTSAFRAIIAVIIISFLRRQTWLTLDGIIGALDSGARRSLSVALPCAVAGIIVGVIVQTNLGLKLTNLIIAASGGQLFVALLLVMIGCIILGMGMPTTSAHIMGAVLLTPALAEMGIVPIAAHMFVFYFCCLSMLTPPVALASFAAAGIAGAPMAQTGWTAFKLSLTAFLVPYAFVFAPALLFQGSIQETLWYSLTALLGVYALAAGIIGYARRDNQVWENVVFLVSAVLLIVPEGFTDLVGFGLLVAMLIYQSRTRPKEERVAA